ncbi:MAG: class I SAM-dependent methyltransferase [bacterium]|nr:class I SAM-dependent methyltransferase [bacterium]
MRSILSYPDENLVRLLKKSLAVKEGASQDRVVVDLGCGSGRHLRLLEELEVPYIVGVDASLNGLKISKENRSSLLIQGDNKKIPLKDNTADIIIAWGSLHYDDKDLFPAMLKEIHRVLKKGGCLLGTLRSVRDSYLRRGKHLGNNVWETDLNDINGTTVSFYSEEELQSSFNIFSNISYGFMERSLLGDMDRVISHWVFKALK